MSTSTHRQNPLQEGMVSRAVIDTPPEPLRFAFAGFRHAHIMSLYRAVARRTDVRIVAACEEDAASAAVLRRDAEVALTHPDFASLLASPCEVVAVGDYYARRGTLILAALGAGKHVISDKPLCTSLSELDQIQALAAAKRLCVGCLLDLRANPTLCTIRRLIREGVIGPVHTVLVTAQHPLLLDSRPAWYFEPGMHGGTLNDIAIHALDLIPWLTERHIVEITAARGWNARVTRFPHFQDGAQFMLRLDNDGSVLGDVSYLAPDRCGYAAPQYWRVTCHGSEGVLEASAAAPLSLATHQDPSFRTVAPDRAEPEGPLESFLLELTGRSRQNSLTTANVLLAARQALLVQEAADQQLHDVRLSHEAGGANPNRWPKERL